MKGITSKRVENFYVVSCNTYEDMLNYLSVKRPNQYAVSCTPEGITLSIPVVAQRVDN